MSHEKSFKLRSPKPRPLIENDVERQCLDALRWRNWKPERLHAGTFKTVDGRRFITGHPKGTPDYVVIHAVFPAFYLEVKRPGQHASPGQKHKHAELHLYRLAVVTVDNYRMLLEWLAEHERKARELWHTLERSNPPS